MLPLATCMPMPQSILCSTGLAIVRTEPKGHRCLKRCRVAKRGSLFTQRCLQTDPFQAELAAETWRWALSHFCSAWRHRTDLHPRRCLGLARFLCQDVARRSPGIPANHPVGWAAVLQPARESWLPPCHGGGRASMPLTARRRGCREGLASGCESVAPRKCSVCERACVWR